MGFDGYYIMMVEYINQRLLVYNGIWLMMNGQ